MVYHFTSREKNILHYLSISDTYILGKQLAAVTGVSERTIRDDIKRINQVLFSEELDDFFELDDNFHQHAYEGLQGMGQGCLPVQAVYEGSGL